MWGVAQAFELSLPPLTTRLHRRIRTSASHLPERWALLTLIVIGESVVAVALQTAGANWRVASVACAVLGFAAVAGVWWLYFDGQADVTLRGSTISVVVYSYAHLPLLIGLAAMSAGVRLLIDRAAQPHLGLGASVALCGGMVLYVLSLIGTRTVTIGGPWRLGIALKLGAVAVMVGLIGAETALPPVAVAAGLAGVLALVIVVERALVPTGRAMSAD